MMEDIDQKIELLDIQIRIAFRTAKGFEDNFFIGGHLKKFIERLRNLKLSPDQNQPIILAGFQELLNDLNSLVANPGRYGRPRPTHY